jgi:hypothetical protein
LILCGSLTALVAFSGSSSIFAFTYVFEALSELLPMPSVWTKMLDPSTATVLFACILTTPAVLELITT